jgi:hypothetical protein
MKWKKSSIKCTPKRHVLYIIKISQNIAQKNSYLQKLKNMLEEQKKVMKTSRNKAMTEHQEGVAHGGSRTCSPIHRII